jgi:hypothetical protein
MKKAEPVHFLCIVTNSPLCPAVSLDRSLAMTIVPSDVTCRDCLWALGLLQDDRRVRDGTWWRGDPAMKEG